MQPQPVQGSFEVARGVVPLEWIDDAITMTPDLPHSGGVNRTGTLRYGV